MRAMWATLWVSYGVKSATVSWTPWPGVERCRNPRRVAPALQGAAGSLAAALDLAQEILAEIRACQAEPFWRGSCPRTRRWPGVSGWWRPGPGRETMASPLTLTLSPQGERGKKGSSELKRKEKGRP